MEKEKKQSKFAGAKTDQEKTDRVKAGGIIATASFLLGGIFQVAWMAYSQQKLGPKGMGLFMPMVGWFFVVASIMALGLPQTICTFVSNHYETEPETAKKFLSDGNKLVIIISLIVIILTVIGAAIAKAAGLINSLYFAMIVVLIISCASALIFWSINSVLNGYQRVDLVSVGNIIFPVGQFAATVAFVMLAEAFIKSRPGLGREWLVVGAVAGMGAGQLFGIAAALILIIRNRMATPGEIFNITTNHGLYKKIITFGGLAAVAMVANAVVQNVTAPVARLVGLNFHIFTEAQIGFYTTSLYYGMVPMLLVGVAIALLPAISEAEGQGRKDLMQQYYTGAMQQCFIMLAALIALYALIVGKIAVLMGGSQFPEELMRALSIRMVVGGSGVAMVFVLTNMFIGLKRPSVPAVISVLVLIGQIGGITASSLIFKNIIMATYGFMLPPIVGCFFMFVIAWKQFGLRFPWWTLAEPTLCALPAWAVAQFVIHRFVPANAAPTVFLAAGAPLCIAIFGLLVWLLESRRKKPAAAENV